MNFKYILIVLGEPYSTFSEIIGKYYELNKYSKKKIILIGSIGLFNQQLKKLKYKLPLNKISDIKYSDKRKINIIYVEFQYIKTFTNISEKSNQYIKKCFDVALEILKKLKKRYSNKRSVSKKNFF